MGISFWVILQLLTHTFLLFKEPALRLIGTANAGRLEVFLDSSKGTICDFGWSRYDASVACKQLGFIDGEPRR